MFANDILENQWVFKEEKQRGLIEIVNYSEIFKTAHYKAPFICIRRLRKRETPEADRFFVMDLYLYYTIFSTIGQVLFGAEREKRGIMLLLIYGGYPFGRIFF